MSAAHLDLSALQTRQCGQHQSALGVAVRVWHGVHPKWGLESNDVHISDGNDSFVVYIFRSSEKASHVPSVSSERECYGRCCPGATGAERAASEVLLLRRSEGENGTFELSKRLRCMLLIPKLRRGNQIICRHVGKVILYTIYEISVAG